MRKDSKKGYTYKVESVAIACLLHHQRWVLVAVNQDQEVSLSRRACYRQ